MYESDDGTIYRVTGGRRVQNPIVLQDSEYMPFAGIYEQCMAALRQTDVRGVYVSWLMSIVIKETNGNAFFDPDDMLYRQCLNDMPFSLHQQRKEWIQKIAVRTGKHTNK